MLLHRKLVAFNTAEWFDGDMGGNAEILDGNLTLGQLIAFRIISGNVTGPLLQLSTLWQGFQVYNFQWNVWVIF